jgi:hypothetical protein
LLLEATLELLQYSSAREALALLVKSDRVYEDLALKSFC